MKPSPKLRPTLWDALVVLTVLVLAILCTFTLWVQDDDTGSLTVVISIDGEVAAQYPLAEFPAEDQLYSHGGYTLRVGRITSPSLDHRLGVAVHASNCPTQDCVHTGSITQAGQSIVCLPARMIIQLEGSQKSNTGPDIIIG